MTLGFVSDSLGGLPFEAMLDEAQRLGVDGAEVNTGSWFTAPHLDLGRMRESREARAAFRRAFDDRGLAVIALNANGNPLHPTDPRRASA